MDVMMVDKMDVMMVDKMVAMMVDMSMQAFECQMQ